MEADIANVLNHVKFSKGFPLVSSSADGAGVGATVTSSIPGKIWSTTTNVDQSMAVINSIEYENASISYGTTNNCSHKSLLTSCVTFVSGTQYSICCLYVIFIMVNSFSSPINDIINGGAVFWAGI